MIHTNEKIIKHKVGLLNLAEELGNVRRIPNIKNPINPAIESIAVDYALEEPAHGQTRASNELRKRGTFVSFSGVRSIWLRHDLACFKDRLKALSDQVAKDGVILTESQVAAMERKKHDDEACGEIDTQHPGFLRIMNWSQS